MKFTIEPKELFICVHLVLSHLLFMIGREKSNLLLLAQNVIILANLV
jgi:hypothetical protein